MDEVIRLHCRIAELEVELRLVKEELTKAHSGNNFLISTLQSQQPVQDQKDTAALQHSLHQANAKIAYLTALSKLNRQSPNKSPSSPSEGESCTAVDPSSPCNQFTGKTLPPFTPAASRHAVPVTTQSTLAATFQRNTTDRTHQERGPNPSYSKVEPWVALNRGNARIPARFTDAEYRRLEGVACFIEEEDEAGLQAYWVAYSKRHPDHTAEQWRSYYEETVRPKYLERFPNHDMAKNEEKKSEGGEWTLIDLDNESSPRGNLEAAELHIPSPTKKSTGLEKQESIQVEATDDGGKILSDSDILLPVSGIPGSSADTPKENDTVERDNPIESDHQTGTLDPNASTFVPSTHAYHESSNHLPNTTPLAGGYSNNYTHELPSSAHPPNKQVEPGQISSKQVPEPKATEEDTFHTVIVSNPPTNVSLADVLSKVEGGTIFSATYLQTAGMRLKAGRSIETNGALIVFCRAAEAQACVKAAYEKPISFFSESLQTDVRANIALVQTPTAPPSTRLAEAIVKYGMTRILYLNDGQRFTPDFCVESLLRFDLSRGSANIRRPLRASRDAEGRLVLEFARIADAGNAWTAVGQNYLVFEDMPRGFLRDPCDTSVEVPKKELQELVEEVREAEPEPEKVNCQPQ